LNCNITYDGTFKGLLTAIFDCFERKLEPGYIQPKQNKQAELFGEKLSVTTDINKADRVLSGLLKRIEKRGLNDLFKVFCSELPERELLILRYCRCVFKIGYNPLKDYRQESILRVSQIVKKINREIHRTHAFVRFQKTKDDIYAATIKPDFDVLQLACKHFEDRYQDQHWMIYDTRRDYGIYYDLNETKTIKLEDPQWAGRHKLRQDHLSEEEKLFEAMWQQYFKATSIVERKNMKLHLQHVPYRYWQYLPEKRV